MGGRFDDVSWVAVISAEVMLVVTSRWRAKLFPEHIPIVYVISYVTLADVLARLLQVLVLRTATYPLMGTDRLAYHMETLLLTGWPAGIGVVAFLVFLPRWRRLAPWAMVGTWIGLNMGLMMTFPPPRGATKSILQAWSMFVPTVVGGLAWMRWHFRWTMAHAVVLFLAATELVVAIVGPYATNPFRDWMVARVIYLITFTTLAICYGHRPALASR